MENFLDNVGFNDYDQDDLIDLLESESANNHLVTTELKSGLKLLQFSLDDYTVANFVVDDDNNIYELSLTHHSENVNTVIPNEWLMVEDDRQYFRMLNVDSQGNFPGLPLNIMVQDADFEFHQELEVSLYAMAVHASLFANEKELSEVSGFAAESLIPSGTFSASEDDEDFVQSCEFLMNSKILEIEQHTNRFSNDFYYVLKVNCLGIDIDIVTYKDEFEREPSVGDIISGIFYLGGNIIQK